MDYRTQAELTHNSSAPEDNAPHLLVVDDDTRIRTLLSQFLTDKGYRVTTAATAAEARRKLEALEFDLAGAGRDDARRNRHRVDTIPA